MGESISVKCPACNQEFSLGDAVLKSVREGLTQEVQATLSGREQELAKRARAIEEQQADLRKKHRK